MERKFIKSGIPGLDEVLGGGLLEGSVITVSGPTGSGKSTLAAQFIYNGALESGEPGLYLAIEESRKEFFFHISGYSWDFNTLEKDRKFVFLDYPIHEVDQIVNQSNAIYEIIHSTGVRRVVIDSIMPVALYFHGDDERKKGFLKFIENLRKWGVTVMIVSEDLKMANSGARPCSEYGIESFTDGWVNIFYRYDERTMERKRYIEVIKMKGVSHSYRSYPILVDNGGIRLVAEAPPPQPEKRIIKKEAPAAPLREVRPIEETPVEELVEKAFSGMEEKPKPQTPKKIMGPPPKPPQAPKQPPKPPPPAAKAAPKPAPKAPPKAAPKPAAAKAAPPKSGARPPPAKMSQSIADRIAEAKRKIMKKE